MLKNVLAAIFSVTLMMPAFAHGDDATTTPIRNVREKAKEEIQAVRESAKQGIQNAREQFEAKREDAKKEIEAKREEFKKTLEAKREDVKNRIEKSREELKTRLGKIKDERKKQVVERVATNLNDLNARMTDHFSNALNQIDDVLNRIGSRADKAEANGKDVATVRTAITNAKNAIVAARAAVAAQVTKVYSPAITTDLALKTDVGEARKALQTDLKTVEDVVKAAREAVHTAAVGLGQIPKVDDFEAPTSTATSTNN